MRGSAGTVANAVAWLVIAGLVVAAILVTDRLGFAGLFLLGGLTWLVCVLATLDEKVPTWGENVFRAAAERPRSAEELAARSAEHQAAMSPLRFFGLCGAFLAIVGAAGFAWQLWGRGPAMTGALLCVLVAAVWLGSAGFARLRAPLDRLHCAAFVTAAGGAALLAASVAAEGLTIRSAKIAMAVAASLAAGAALSHALGRATVQRSRGK